LFNAKCKHQGDEIPQHKAKRHEGKTRLNPRPCGMNRGGRGPRPSSPSPPASGASGGERPSMDETRAAAGDGRVKLWDGICFLWLLVYKNITCSYSSVQCLL
jgi:hypothetical protein